jgi:Na+-transporting NADH:ubiquinone oxidoreductase subunit NqrC
VTPDFGAVTGNTLASVVGALLTVVLVAAVASLIVSAICWGFGEAQGNYQLASKAKTGLLVALGTAIAAGGGIAWMNFLIHVGETL